MSSRFCVQNRDQPVSLQQHIFFKIFSVANFWKFFILGPGFVYKTGNTKKENKKFLEAFFSSFFKFIIVKNTFLFEFKKVKLVWICKQEKWA